MFWSTIYINVLKIRYNDEKNHILSRNREYVFWVYTTHVFVLLTFNKSYFRTSCYHYPEQKLKKTANYVTWILALKHFKWYH